jgi:hypothetical protein
MIVELGKVTEETKAVDPIAPFIDDGVYHYKL